MPEVLLTLTGGVGDDKTIVSRSVTAHMENLRSETEGTFTYAGDPRPVTFIAWHFMTTEMGADQIQEELSGWRLGQRGAITWFRIRESGPLGVSPGAQSPSRPPG